MPLNRSDGSGAKLLVSGLGEQGRIELLPERLEVGGGAGAGWKTSVTGPQILGFCSALLLVAGGAGASPTAVPSELHQKARETGTLRVLVQLQVTTFPEGELRGPDAVAAQRAAIAAAQSTVLAQLAGTSYRVTRIYETIPFLALDVSPDALRALERSPLVVRVEEDRVDSPHRTPNRPLDDKDLPANANRCIQT